MPSDRVNLSLTPREAASLSRSLEVCLKFGTEGKDILHFGDKRRAREIQVQLAMPSVTEVKPNAR